MLRLLRVSLIAWHMAMLSAIDYNRNLNSTQSKSIHARAPTYGSEAVQENKFEYFSATEACNQSISYVQFD